MKTPIENIVTTLTGKKVLFLENDNGLYNGLDQFEQILIDNNIEYKCLFDVQGQELSSIIKAIKECDAIVFQTTWVYEKSRMLRDYLFESVDKKIIIECFSRVDPTWFYKPDVVHDVYIAQHMFFRDPEWTFCKLTKKPYWDYKNKFDK